jgi:hypothetical protein
MSMREDQHQRQAKSQTNAYLAADRSKERAHETKMENAEDDAKWNLLYRQHVW